MKFYRIAVFFLCGIVLLGCGADEEAAYEAGYDKAPVVSIEKVGQEMNEDGETMEITVKVVSDRAPKNDLLVDMYIESWECDDFHGKIEGWATIPKGKKSSNEYSLSGSINAPWFAGVVPLPTVSVVGEGEVINKEKLEYSWGNYTLDDQKIPEGYEFAYYEVAESSTSYLYRPGKAKIVSVDPPNGTLLIESGWGSPDKFPHMKSEVTITFDKPPECPVLFLWDRHYYKQGTTIVVDAPFSGSITPTLRFAVEWGDSEDGTAGEQSFVYPVAFGGPRDWD